MFFPHRGTMHTTTIERSDEATEPRHCVRTDLRAGLGVLVVVIGGNLLWHASDAGIIAALGGR